MEAEETYLPWELIIEILARLPLKSLLRFRSVSKSCDSLITDPHFINKQFKNSNKVTSHTQKGIILSPTTKFHKHVVSCPLSSLYHKPIDDAAKLAYPMKDKRRFFKISDSVNGLFCFEVLGDGYESWLFLWNPSTRESKMLPKPRIETPHDSTRYEFEGMNHVLGFDLLNNDYKVLGLVRCDDMNTKIEPYIYSLCNDSWRKIDESPCYKCSDYSNVRRRKTNSYTELPFSSYKYVNGAIHWFGVEKNAVSSSKIISLHMSTERFGELALPNCEVMQYPHNGLEINIAVLRGMLCVYRNRAEQSFDLWAMKNYGDHESWEKIVNIQYPMTGMLARLYHTYMPLYLYENGDILLEASSCKAISLVMYNRNRVGFAKVAARGLARILEGHVFAETLVSPTPTGIKCIQVNS